MHFRYLKSKLVYLNNCVHEKNVSWIEDDIKVVTEFSCLLGHPVSEHMQAWFSVCIIYDNISVFIFHTYLHPTIFTAFYITLIY